MFLEPFQCFLVDYSNTVSCFHHLKGLLVLVQDIVTYERSLSEMVHEPSSHLGTVGVTAEDVEVSSITGRGK